MRFSWRALRAAGSTVLRPVTALLILAGPFLVLPLATGRERTTGLIFVGCSLPIALTVFRPGTAVLSLPGPFVMPVLAV